MSTLTIPNLEVDRTRDSDAQPGATPALPCPAPKGYDRLFDSRPMTSASLAATAATITQHGSGARWSGPGS